MNKIFEQLTRRRIITFIKILSSIKSKDISFIKRKYLENENYFSPVFEYLQAIGVIKKQKDNIKIKDRNLIECFDNEEKLNSYLIEKTLGQNIVFTNYVSRYLQNFKSINGSFIYKPLSKDRIKKSGLRNFLIEISLIYHSRANNSYVVNENFLHLFLKKLDQKSLSQKTLNSILKNQEELGYLAELKIIEYEKMRLNNFPKLINNIEHTAKNNVRAGYDIKSWEKNDKERYIEVKAVSLSDFCFHWSRNEIDKSKQLKNQYFLYLLPVITKNEFDINSIEIIKDPYKIMFNKSSDWCNQIEEYSFWKEN